MTGLMAGLLRVLPPEDWRAFLFVLSIRAAALGLALALGWGGNAALAAAPGVPTGFSAAAGDARVLLYWQPPSSGDAPTRYEYQVRDHSLASPWSDFVSVGTALSAVVTQWPGQESTNKVAYNFVNGNIYRFRVRACNSDGCSVTAPNLAPPNHFLEATPAAGNTLPTTPGAPTNLTATGGANQIALSWTAPASNGGLAVTGYQYQQDGGAWQSAGTGTSHTVTGLNNGTSYTYKVRAVNALGGGTASGSASATPADWTAPVPVRAVSYLGTVQVIVGDNGNAGDGFSANGSGALLAGEFPRELFSDGRDRAPAAVLANGGVLTLTYAELTDDLYLDNFYLRWLRAQIRTASGSVVYQANLWESQTCTGADSARSLCLSGAPDLSAYDGAAVGLDFFDAQTEALTASPGGIGRIAFNAGATAADETGFDATNGALMSGVFPAQWFTGGEALKPAKVAVLNGAAGERLELAYDAGRDSGQWKTDPKAYRKYRLSLRDRDGEELARWGMREALEASTESYRRCGDTQAERRLCLPLADDTLNLAPYRGQALVLMVEDQTWIAMLAATPGGPVGAQLGLGLFGAIVFAIFFRKARSPQRESVILVAGAGSSCLPAIFGYGDIYWAGAIFILALAGAAGWWFFTKSR